MALTPVAVPQYPTVPKAPGVPPLARALDTITTVNNVVGATVAIVSRISSLLFPKVWGVFRDDGTLALAPDTIRSIGYRVDYHVPDYQIEEGGFGTYNKTAMPFDSQIVMVKSGSVDDKTTFILQLKDMVESLDLYTIVTPEDTFESVNLTGIRYDRDLRHVQAMEVEVSFKEIRIVDAGQFTETKDASSATTENNGSVSSQSPTSSQANSASQKSDSVARSNNIKEDTAGIKAGMKSNASISSQPSNVTTDNVSSSGIA